MRCFILPVLVLTSVSGSVDIVWPHKDPNKKVAAAPPKDSKQIMERMKALEAHLAERTLETANSGHLLVNGPLPSDFSERFAQAVGKATGADASTVKFTGSQRVEQAPGVVEIGFSAPPNVVNMIENEAADSNSQLSQGNLHSFLVAREHDDHEEHADHEEQEHEENALEHAVEHEEHAVEHAVEHAAAGHKGKTEATPVQEKGIDIDTQMPYGDLEPFGREDTAQELTESSVTESDQMVDQLERAEVAEEKRAVFRALTRLRGAAITSFDGVARSQTGNIDEYNKVHKWRKSHPVHHLADEESDVSKWAFPDNADLLQKSHHK